jgi:hypothetical protein
LAGCSSKSAEGQSKESPPAQASAAAAAPSAEAAKPPSSDPVDQYVAALEATPKCEKQADGIAAKDTSVCLKPMWEALKAIDSPPGDSYEAKKAAREALQKRLARELALALSHRDRTVVHYAVYQNQTRLERTSPVTARLEQLMGDSHESTAQWASIARFRDPVADDATTQALAKATLADASKPASVRKAACDYFHGAVFKGNRDHFALLKKHADDAKEPALVRSSALTGMGYIGTEKDIPVISKYLSDESLQYSALYALKHGISTRKSFDAYIGYFARNARKPGAVQHGSILIFAPFASDKGKFDFAKAKKALADIAATKTHKPFVSDAATRVLGELQRMG